jgi:2-oxoisovalerate dehydrogenase E1 component alpha subunit
MTYLVGQKMWTKADEEHLAPECHERIEAAVERYPTMAPRWPETMFDHLYADLPEAYAAQRRKLAGENDA